MDHPSTPDTADPRARLGIRYYRYRAILKRHWRILAITAALGLLYQGWVLLNKPERFVSVGKISLDQPDGNASRALAQEPNRPGTISAMIKSPIVLERAAKRAAQRKPEYEALAGTVEINAGHEPGTSIFAVSGAGRHRGYTQVFVTAVMDAFIAKHREEQSEAARNRPDAPAAESFSIYQPSSEPAPEPRQVLRHLLLGLLGGLLLGLIVLFFLDRTDDRITSSSEIIGQFAEPFLGQIPDLREGRADPGRLLLRPDDQRLPFAEAFRGLRSSLLFLPNWNELKTLLITSAVPGEGRSTIATNLALTMAQAGTRVLLVDGDLRRGQIGALLKSDGRTGLANVLRGEAPWKSAVQIRDDHLHFIPHGTDAKARSGSPLADLLGEWKAAYDLVIFNSAPVLTADDTLALAPKFDGTLLVIRAGFTSARLVRNALTLLHQSQTKIPGIILNAVDSSLADYSCQDPKYDAAKS